MSKKLKLSYGLIPIILLNFLYWLCNNYPKHILEFDAKHSIISIAINVIFFSIYNFFLVLIFCKNKTVYSKDIIDNNLPLYKRVEFRKIAFLFGIQLIVDTITILLNKTSVQLFPYFTDILMIVNWIVIYLVLTSREFTFLKNKKVTLVTVVIMLSVFVINAILNIVIFSDYLKLMGKYEESAPILNVALNNAKFLYEIKSLAVDSIFATLLITAHIISNHSHVKSKEYGKKSRVFIRISIFFIAFVILFFSKITIWPDRCICGSRANDSKITNYEEYGMFDEYRRYEEIYRYSKSLKGVQICYSKYDIQIQKDNIETVFLRFYNKDILHKYRAEQNKIIENEYIYKCFENNVKAYLYNSTAVCFYDNNVPKIVLLSELNDCEENLSITYVCEKLISDGNVYIFEYACEYLVKYDFEFVENYISRYSNGEFTKTELRWMEISNYNPQFVEIFAKQFVN